MAGERQAILDNVFNVVAGKVISVSVIGVTKEKSEPIKTPVVSLKAKSLRKLSDFLRQLSCVIALLQPWLDDAV